MGSLVDIRTEIGSLDLLQGADTAFFITKQIYDLNNFEGKNSNFTSRLEIPATPLNSIILNRSNQQGQAVESKIQCSITLDSITIAPVAWLLVSDLEINKNSESFFITIFYGNFNLFDDLKGVTLSELNWADTNTDWVTNIVKAKSTHTYLDNDVVIPVCDWYDRESYLWTDSEEVYTQIMDINLQGFFIYCRNVIQRMVEQAGFTLVVEDSVPEQFNWIALACPVEKFIEPPVFEGVVPSVGLAYNDIEQTQQSLTDSQMLLQFQSRAENITFGSNEFTIIETGNYEIAAQGIYNHSTAHPQASDSAIEIRLNGTEIKSLQIPLDGSTVSFDVRTVTPLIAGDVVNVFLHSGRRNNNQINTLEILSGASLAVVSVGAEESRIVSTADHLPDMEQAEFLANILKLYNLFVITDDVNKTVTLSSFNSVYTSEEVDLTNKFSVNESVTIELFLSSIGKKSDFNWQEDNLLRRDANSFLRFNNSLLNDESTIISMEFSACDVSAMLDQNFIAPIGELKAKIPLVNTEYERLNTGGLRVDILADGNFTFNEETVNFEVGHFIRCETYAGQVGWYRVLAKYSDSTGLFQSPAVAVTAGIVYSHLRPAANTFTARLALIAQNGSEDNYYWQNGTEEDMLQLTPESYSAIWPDSLRMSSISELYYGQIMGALKTPHVIKARFNITAAEFSQLDLTRPVYLANYGAQYYINRVDQFKVDNLTQIELVRISNIADNGS